MTLAPKLGWTELTVGEGVPETAVNELALLITAAASSFIFKSRSDAAPPASPAQLDSYLVAASPTGAWSGQAGKIAIYLNTSWVFVTVQAGFIAYVADELGFIVFDGTSWDALGLTVDDDGTMAADSHTAAPTQAAVIAYVAAQIAAAVTGLLDLKGGQDCSANPNYPAASKGDAYVVTVAGKIGGASGTSVAVGDVFFATADNAGGTQAAVGASWDTIVHSASLSGALLAANNLSDVANAATALANLGGKASAPNVQSVTSAATVTPTFSNDLVKITAQAAALTLANPTGTAVPGWGMGIRIKDNGSAQTIAYGAQYRAIGVTLPTTTVAGKTLYLGMIYNSDDTKWDVVAVAQQA